MHTLSPRLAGGTPTRDALRFVGHNERLLALFIGFTVVSTFAFNYNVVLPKLADVMWGNPNAFGWILAVSSFGSLLGSLLTARMHRVTYGWVVANVLVLGVSNIALAWSPNMWVAFVCAIPLGFGGAAMIAGPTVSQDEVTRRGVDFWRLLPWHSRINVVRSLVDCRQHQCLMVLGAVGLSP